MSVKADLRRQIKAMRDAIPAGDRQEFSRCICGEAVNMAHSGESVFVYASVGSEVLTDELIRALREKGCRVCLPKITGRGCMEAAEYRPGEKLQCDRFGIPYPVNGEVIPPEEIAAAFVPGLAFDAAGQRLGYGGGYYDRWLARSGARRIGLAYGCQLIEAVAAEARDIPVDALVTEHGLVRFR